MLLKRSLVTGWLSRKKNSTDSLLVAKNFVFKGGYLSDDIIESFR